MDIILFNSYIVSKPKDVGQADPIDDFCRCKSIYLLCKDMIQSLCGIWIELLILVDYGLSETEALRLIATLLMQESAAALSVTEEEPEMTLCYEKGEAFDRFPSL